jgi:hypothetical protein
MFLACFQTPKWTRAHASSLAPALITSIKMQRCALIKAHRLACSAIFIESYLIPKQVSHIISTPLRIQDIINMACRTFVTFLLAATASLQVRISSAQLTD